MIDFKISVDLTYTVSVFEDSSEVVQNLSTDWAAASEAGVTIGVEHLLHRVIDPTALVFNFLVVFRVNSPTEVKARILEEALFSATDGVSLPGGATLTVDEVKITRV